MSAVQITIDGRRVEVEPGRTVLEAARKIGLDIPTLCHLEKCGPLTSCLVCLVKVAHNGQGRLVPSCATRVEPGMVIESETEEVHQARRTALELLFSDHVGDCLSPCQRLCPLQLNIPMMLRQIQAARLDEAIATVRQALPLAGVLGRLCHHPCEQGCRRGLFDDPAAIRDMERFLTDHDLKQDSARSIECLSQQAASGKQSVAIIGAGPAGLAAAYDLARRRCAVTVMDRNAKPGGQLRHVPEEHLPAAVMQAEIALLAHMGVHFRAGVELGNQVTLEGLRREFDAILLATGAASAVRADPATCLSSAPNIFAAGACVKPVKQLVRAMAEGRAAAECVHRFLRGQPPRRPEKPFSSLMGRLEPGELKEFLREASHEHRVAPCDRCAGASRQEAGRESARCLHCDCRSSGQCLLQHYAQVYGADASRFRSERRPFVQQSQPGGVIFEPGKCIDCGICIKLTGMAAEPLGLAFVGRGFNVRVAAPFDRPIQEGLQKVAEECVRHCPTGALAFADKV
jgi:ferredoxin